MVITNTNKTLQLNLSTAANFALSSIDGFIIYSNLLLQTDLNFKD